jgi:uncharacterized protein
MSAMQAIHRTLSTGWPMLLALLLGYCGTAARAERVEDLPKPTDYVNDYAHVLSPQSIGRLDRVCVQLDRPPANAQIAVVTVETLNGADAADYANDLETKWKIGRKGSDRGVLILLAISDHKRRIDVGYGLEGILPDGKLGDIGREMVPDLRANDFDGAVTLAVDELSQVIATDANVTLDENPMPIQPAPARPRPVALIFVLIVMGSFFVLRVVLALFNSVGLGGVPWNTTLSRRSGSDGGSDSGSTSVGAAGAGGGGSDSGFGGFSGGSFGGGGAGGDW